MTCVEFERLLHERLDRRQTLDAAELDLHAARCSSCRALRRRMVLVLVGFQSAPIPLPSPALESRVRFAAGRQPRMMSWATGALAAGLAAAAVLAVLLLGQRRPSERPAPAAVQFARNAPDRSLAAAPLRLSLADASVAGRELIRETAGPISELAAGLLPAPHPVVLPEPPLDDAVGVVKEFPSRVQAKARPLTAAVGHAFQFLVVLQ